MSERAKLKGGDVHDHEVVVRDQDGDELCVYERDGRLRLGVAARDGRGYAVFLDQKGVEKLIRRLLEARPGGA